MASSNVLDNNFSPTATCTCPTADDPTTCLGSDGTREVEFYFVELEIVHAIDVISPGGDETGALTMIALSSRGFEHVTDYTVENVNKHCCWQILAN